MPVLRMQALSHLPAWAFGLLCGGAMFSLLIVPVLVLDLSTTAALEILGNALFFGLSVSIVAGATGSVIRGAERDLAQLRGVVVMTDEQFECLTRCLSRQSTRTSLVLLVLGLFFGGLHNYLLGQYDNRMPFLLTQTSATFFMWVIMLAVLPKITQNAMTFSRLGSAAKPDLLRPSRHAAFGAAALRPAVFLIGTICMYGFLMLGDNDPFDQGVWIGIASSLVTLIGIVVFPLKGIRARIMETRQESLAALDARIESLDIGDVANASVKVMDEMDTVLDMRERVARAPGWPLDLAGIRRILLYIVLPPLTWAAAAIVEMLIDSAL
ncbi:MAG: hypothetical protein AAGG55_08735 [Pseudomonadota bacterium]